MKDLEKKQRAGIMEGVMLLDYAWAKLNLHLQIQERRNDGFHNIVSLVQRISLCDRVELGVEEGRKAIKLFTTGFVGCRQEDNLAWRAAHLFQEKGGKKDTVTIHLHKRIPTGAGLGGGSADAASVLGLLNHYYGYIFTEQQLLNMAGELGSDVPMCLNRGAWLVKGRGEKLEKLPSRTDLYFLVVVPENWHCSTSLLYREFDRQTTQNVGIEAESLSQIWLNKPDSWLFYNDFAETLKKLLPDMKYYIETLHLTGAQRVGISGSGSALWGVYDSLEVCRKGQKQLVSDCDCWAIVSFAVF